VQNTCSAFSIIRRFLAGCELVELAFAEVLSDPGERIRRVYFPTESFISLVTPIGSCAGIEVGLFSDEGMLGPPSYSGCIYHRCTLWWRGEGPALRMNAATFRRELAESPALQRGLKRYL
jgi:hypothetical protein